MNFIPIVLCAGFGTRLRPLTHYVPKPVVPVGNRPVAYYSIKRLLDFGADVVHCNTHFLPEVVTLELQAALASDGFEPSRIRFWNEPEILETGGGIVNIVQSLLSEDKKRWTGRDIIAIAGDVFANPPLEDMAKRWEEKSSDTCALMCTRTLRTARPDVTWVDTLRNEVVGFGKDISGPLPHLETRLFSTHQIIDHNWVAQSPLVKESSRDIFYRAGLKSGRRILNVNYPEEGAWYDIGDYASLASCSAALASSHQQSVLCLTPTFTANSAKPLQLSLVRLITPVINQFRSTFVTPSGVSLSQSVHNLLNQAHLPNQFLPQNTATPTSLNISPGESRIVISAASCPVNLPYPLLISLENLEDSTFSNASAQTSSTLFLFPSQNS